MAGVKIVAVLTAKAGKADELRQLLDGMLAPSRAEAGCLRYDLWRDQANAERFVLDELYVDDAAIAAHKETAHFRDYLAKIADLAERTAFVVDTVDVS
jgi:quinol monooxygenase YgiN